MSPEVLAAQQASDFRLQKLANQGIGVQPEKIQTVRLLAYLEVLLGDRLDEAELHFHARIGEMLSMLEVQAPALTARSKLVGPGGMPPMAGRG